MSGPGRTDATAAGTGPSAAPFAVAALAVFLFAVMDALIKHVAAIYPTVQIVTLRFACGVPFALALGWWLELRLPGPAAWRAHGLRGLLTVATGLQFFYALAILPLAQAIALFFLAPLFLALLAALILREPIRGSTWASLALGFCGVGIMLGGEVLAASGSLATLAGAAAALGSALTYALNAVLLRRRALADPLAVIVLLQHVIPLGLTLPFTAVVWLPPSPAHWLLFLVTGALGVSAMTALAWAFARAPAGRLGILEYTALVWAAAIGWYAFGELPSLATLGGAFLIVAACLLGTWRQGEA